MLRCEQLLWLTGIDRSIRWAWQNLYVARNFGRRSFSDRAWQLREETRITELTLEREAIAEHPCEDAEEGQR